MGERANITKTTVRSEHQRRGDGVEAAWLMAIRTIWGGAALVAYRVRRPPARGRVRVRSCRHNAERRRPFPFTGARRGFSFRVPGSRLRGRSLTWLS
jgi:hypothetical protein